MAEGDISRREAVTDIAKGVGVGLAALMSLPIKSEVRPSREDLKVGDLNVHFLAFDHIEGVAGVPKAKAAFEAIKAVHPDTVPMFEYFPPEINVETNNSTPKSGEFGNICASYGTLIDQAQIHKVLVADPAYNYKFIFPETLPMVAGAGLLTTGMVESLKVVLSNPDIMSRGQFFKTVAKGARALIATGLGISTAGNAIRDAGSGIRAMNKPLELPSMISEVDFRTLTVAHALENLGEMTDIIKTKNVVLIYPPIEIDKIRAILKLGSENWARTNLKFDFYKALYSALDIIKTREWTKTSAGWEKTKQIAIDSNFIGQAGK